MKVVLAGGGGFIGRSLTRHYASGGWDVVILSRRADVLVPGARVVPWDGRTVGAWTAELEGADLLVNLAGRSVNCRYHSRNRREIMESRVNSTRVLGESVGACSVPPPLWINAASATIYRHAENRAMDEANGEIGKGFSVDVCRAWEDAVAEAETRQTRKVLLRMAMVMGPEPGGVFTAFRLLARLGLGGTLGPGTQYMSWLHHEDLFAMLEWIRLNGALDGIFNACAPCPLPNREFMRTMRKACGVPIGLPAARWMLETGAFFLRTETELLLKSRRVVPARLLQSGFRFRYPEFPEAARDIAAEIKDLKFEIRN